MKKLVVLLVVVVLLLALSAPAFAAGHETKPIAHRDTGREFGGAIAESVQNNPFILVDHVGGRLPW